MATCQSCKVTQKVTVGRPLRRWQLGIGKLVSAALAFFLEVTLDRAEKMERMCHVHQLPRLPEILSLVEVTRLP
jgi:hypothetical protein